jgi:hypothetical protein
MVLNLDDHECSMHLDSYDTLIINPDVFKRQRGRAPDELNNR